MGPDDYCHCLGNTDHNELTKARQCKQDGDLDDAYRMRYPKHTDAKLTK